VKFIFKEKKESVDNEVMEACLTFFKGGNFVDYQHSPYQRPNPLLSVASIIPYIV